MKNNLPNIKHEDLHFACLCAGLRRRNAGLCLKCEISMMSDMSPEHKQESICSFYRGYDKAKNDVLRLLEQ